MASDGEVLAVPYAGFGRADHADAVRAGPDDDAVTDGGVALAGIPAAAAERDAVINRDVVTHLRGFADHHPGRMVDEQAGTENRGGMDFDPGQDAGEAGWGAAGSGRCVRSWRR